MQKIKTVIGESGKKGSVLYYEYDQQGNLINLKYVNDKGDEEFTKYKYTYDSQDNWIEKIEVTNEGKETTEKRKIYYKYQYPDDNCCYRYNVNRFQSLPS